MLGPMENWLLLALVGVVVLLVVRELLCWYWKQSEQVNLLKDIRASLRRLEGLEDDRGRAPAVRPEAERDWRDRVFARFPAL
jgi:hypothetical protein